MVRSVALEDFMRIGIVSDPQVAPDGDHIACVLRVGDVDKNRYRNELWVVPVHQGEPKRFTNEESSNSCPRWSPDGSQIAFISDRQKPQSHIYLLPIDGGEAQVLTKWENEGNISRLCWSPDGTKIAFLFRATPEEYRKDQVEERTKKGLSSPVRIHTRLLYRLDGSGYFDGEYSQIWVADVATGQCRPLTTGPYPCSLPSWSPDSKTLAFLSDRRDGSDLTTSREEIYTVPIEGGDLTCIPTPPGPKFALAWSPDGTRFAYVGNPALDDSWGTGNHRLMIVNSEGAETALDLTGAFDLAVEYLTLSDSHDVGAGELIQWSQDGEQLFFPVSTFGDTLLYRVASDGSGAPFRLTPQSHEMGDFGLSADSRTLAVTLGSSVAPPEMYVAQLESLAAPIDPHWEQRTEFNRRLLDEICPVDPTPISIRKPSNIPGNPDFNIHGWLLKPADFKPTQSYPLVVYVHGGPHAQYGNSFFHELQFLAANGYVVLYANPRGSKGYGEAHTKAIIGGWGGPDFDDLMDLTDKAVDLEYVDPHRIAIMGGSYGGFMTAWAVGHTHRFRCAIADRLVGNLHSMSGTCDFPWLHGIYFKGDAWNAPSDLWRCSPLAYADQITTPLLIIHSDGDLRCPAGQAEELFAALRMQRKIVEFVRYPAESSHGMSRNGPPDLRQDRLRRNLAWLDRWLKTEDQRDPQDHSG